DDRDALIGLVSHEEEHRRERKYPSIPSKEGKNEYFLSRKNNLKKYVESSLYLKTSEGKEGKVLETIFSGIAAGLAMVFATAITFIAQVKFGNFTTSFFVALVLGYIFKDTIKVSLKSYLKYTSKKNLFDRKTKVYADEKNIGIIKESFDFELEKDLHKSVLILKSKDAIDDIDVSMSDETILKYSKKIRLLTNELRMKGYTVGAINDISRINIKRYITKMSDPAKVIDYLDGGKVVSIEGEMVYHIDIIMRFISGEKIMYKRLRLVLNRDGIKNIEEVDSKQEDIKEKMNWESMMKHIPVKIHFPKV
ncbi:MAG: hypothetical protein NDI94_05690, partial [Candidatus Woesearchaeota archaeon]|nr:hypothetical protein [Candidatus Woesearchaeota archaeon]